MDSNEQGQRETMSAAQAVKLLGVSRMTVWRLLRDGHLEGCRLTPYANSRWMVYADSVEKYLQERGAD